MVAATLPIGDIPAYLLWGLVLADQYQSYQASKANTEQAPKTLKASLASAKQHLLHDAFDTWPKQAQQWLLHPLEQALNPLQSAKGQAPQYETRLLERLKVTKWSKGPDLLSEKLCRYVKNMQNAFGSRSRLEAYMHSVQVY